MHATHSNGGCIKQYNKQLVNRGKINLWIKPETLEQMKTLQLPNELLGKKNITDIALDTTGLSVEAPASPTLRVAARLAS